MPRIALGYDVRQKLALELGDLVLQHQLALLQPLDLQLVERRVARDLADYVVKVAMFQPKGHKPFLHILGLVHRRRSPPDRQS